MDILTQAMETAEHAYKFHIHNEIHEFDNHILQTNLQKMNMTRLVFF